MDFKRVVTFGLESLIFRLVSVMRLLQGRSVTILENFLKWIRKSLVLHGAATSELESE